MSVPGQVSDGELKAAEAPIARRQPSKWASAKAAVTVTKESGAARMTKMLRDARLGSMANWECDEEVQCTLYTQFMDTDTPAYGCDVFGTIQAAMAAMDAIKTAPRGIDEDPPLMWLDVAFPQWSDVEFLGQALQLHTTTVEDIITAFSEDENRDMFDKFPEYSMYLTHIMVPGQYKDPQNTSGSAITKEKSVAMKNAASAASRVVTGKPPPPGSVGGGQGGGSGRSSPSMEGGKLPPMAKRGVVVADARPKKISNITRTKSVGQVSPSSMGTASMTDEEEGGSECTEVFFLVQRRQMVTLRVEDIDGLIDGVCREKMIDPAVFGPNAKKVDMLLFELLERIQNTWSRPTKVMSRRIDLTEKMVYESQAPQLLKDISMLRREASLFRTRLQARVESLHSLIKKIDPELLSGSTAFFNDLAEDAEFMQSKMENSVGTAGDAMNTYMALKSDQMNNTMERLAVLTMVLTPMGVIVGLFGMNVQVPGQADVNPTYLGFVIICSCMLTMALSCVGIYFKYGF